MLFRSRLRQLAGRDRLPETSPAVLPAAADWFRQFPDRHAAEEIALLTAANPAQAMTDHEKSLLDRQGGISAPANPPAQVMEAIRKNTQLLNEFGADSVPYIVVKNARTGQLDTRSGALETDALAQFVGVAP